LSNTANIGRSPGATGTLVVDSGGTFSVSDEIVVGDLANGTITIQNGGHVSSVRAYVGKHYSDLYRGTGAVTVTGTGSTWTNSNSLYVGVTPGFWFAGSGGRGVLTIEDGGHVDSYFGFIEDQSTVNVAGAGSAWATTSLRVYYGTLNIQNGGTVANDGIVEFAGSATVTGPGSSWVIDGDLSFSGNGALNIRDAGVVTNTSASVGSSDGGDFHVVTVEGAGSTWTNTGDLIVGTDYYIPNAWVGLSEGGTISVGGLLLVHHTGVVGGNGTLTATVVNFGGVGADSTGFGVTPPGILHVDGDYLQAAEAYLTLYLRDTSDYDRLQVSGDVALNGTLLVGLANSFQPSAGDIFDILDWGSLSGTFDSVQLPALPAGLSWSTSRLYTTGELWVIGASVPADYDGDYDVDGDDLDPFEACASGPGVTLAPGCQSRDLDNDGDTDQSDFGILQRCLSGPDAPADPNCAS
jgi:T5SS/PEP-CTERM-associated repeat protein